MPRLSPLMAIGLLACGLAALPAVAQTSPPPAPPPGAGPAAPGGGAGGGFVEEFNAANATHDGRLTLQQAQAAAPTSQHMALLVRRFAQVDVQHKGYVTLQDIRVYRQQQRAARAPLTNNN